MIKKAIKIICLAFLILFASISMIIVLLFWEAALICMSSNSPKNPDVRQNLEEVAPHVSMCLNQGRRWIWKYKELGVIGYCSSGKRRLLLSEPKESPIVEEII